MQYKNGCLILCLLSLFAVAVYAQRPRDRIKNGPSIREEEALIRTAYAKMSYADEVRIVLDELQRTGRDKFRTAKANAADVALLSRLNFQLKDFRFGKISNIADRKMADFDGVASAIGGEVLDVTPSLYNYSVDNAPPVYVSYIKFAWKPSPYRFLPSAESWPVAKALQSEQFEGKKYTDYVTYTVTVTLNHKSRTYNTWMLFGLDDKGKRQVYFMDPVADPTAVTFALEHSLYPAAFVETDLHGVPFVEKWLYENARSCDGIHNEKDNRADVCCDPEGGRCGVKESSLLPHDSRWKPSPRAPRLMPASFHIPPPPVHAMMQTTGCAQFNVNNTFQHSLADIQEHSNGSHSFGGPVVGTCTYTDGATSPGPCNVQCNAQASSVIDEVGNLTGLVFVHATSKTDSSGGNFANGGTAVISCMGMSAGTVRSCTFPCSTNVTITAGGKGNIGASINFPPNALWNDQNQGTMNCQPQTTVASGGGGGGGGGGCDPTVQVCVCDSVPLPGSGPNASHLECDPGTSPIIIDTEGEGFHLTSAEKGVLFDIRGDGLPMQLGWTDQHSRNAFLALPGADGLVHNGKELFGNFTPQPPAPHRNGFLALAVFDKPENGGNGDGVIDEHDSVFSKLRLWIDENHDGICQPNELHRLPELGVYSLSLNYSESRRVDEFGNQFRYKARVNPGSRRDPKDETPSGDPGRWTYDVFLTTH